MQNIKKQFKLFAFLLLILLSPAIVLAGENNELQKIYDERPDLQAAFDSETWQAIPGTGAGFLIDLEDWARQYGCEAYAELADYAPEIQPMIPGAASLPEVTAENYIVIDDMTGKIIAAENADTIWPVASLTKLATSKVAFDSGMDLLSFGDVLDEDNVGGARLYVESGTVFLILDLFRATLIGSANNAANAIARLSGFAREDFIEQMNNFASSLNLSRTSFVDPTGIEVENQSTAREIAYLAHEVFQNEDLRRMSGTTRMHIEAENDPEYVRDIYNTNWLLYYPEYDDVYVTAGKTGYLEESQWNLVVRMHPMGENEDRSLLIVILGADSRGDSTDDAYDLARWAWDYGDWGVRE